jgi:hypothetical protein
VRLDSVAFVVDLHVVRLLGEVSGRNMRGRALSRIASMIVHDDLRTAAVINALVAMAAERR